MPKGGNMKKILTLGLGIASLAAIGIAVIPAIAQAQGSGNIAKGNGYGNQQSMQTKADMFGITQDELKTQLQTKTMLQIAEDKGISEDQFHAAMQTAAQARWAERGLTEAEINSRLENMQERQAAGHEVNSANRGGGQHNRYNQ
jgi:hypothetical protein